jgi:tetratricopeptide (TPR) repeat protein
VSGTSPRADADAAVARAADLPREHRHDEAARRCREILAATPQHAPSLHLLGLIHHQQGDHAAALQHIAAVLRLEPDSAAAHSNLGLALQGLGRQQEAVASYDRALALRPDHAEALNNRGTALQALGRLDEAVSSYDAALALRPDYVDALFNRAGALGELGRHAEVLASLDRALELRPDDAEMWTGRGVALEGLGRLEEALASHERALGLRPDLPEALNNCGNALHGLGRSQEALACYARALALRPGYAKARNNRGAALQALLRCEEAIASFAEATALQPGYAEAHLHEGLSRLLIGDFERGLPKLEWRWRIPRVGLLRRPLRTPPWRGEEPVAGRTILLHAEQGFGDTLHFARYAQPLAARGARVVLVAQPAVVSLLRGLEGVERVLAEGEALPAFDLHCPLMSLPLAFGTRLGSIPGTVPYLAPAQGRVERWRARLGPATRRRVGLVWSGRPDHGNDRSRSIPLERLAPLLAAPGIEWVSLQREVRVSDEAALREAGILHLGDELADFEDTAALMTLLDLVVTVDTAAAHLAGALARPLWILLSFSPDWRWLLGRQDSPWYPTARLFRQPQPGDWDPVLRRAGELLARG